MNDEIYIVPEIYDTFAAWLDRLLEDNEMPERKIGENQVGKDVVFKE